MRNKRHGIGVRKTRACFLTSGFSLTSIYFRCIGSYVLISMSIVDGPVAPKPPSQVSAGISISGRNSTFVTVFTLRPSRVRDLVTMVEAGPTPGLVKTGVGSVSRGAGTEPNSPDRSVRPTLRLDQSPYLLPAISSNYCLLTWENLGSLSKL